MESIDEGIKPFEHERLLEFPRSSRLPLVREVGRQGNLVLLQAKVCLGWSLGIVLTRKHVLNSFKLRMETLTLSSPSSTWNQVKATCALKPHLNLEDRVWVEELASHVNQEVASLLREKVQNTRSKNSNGKTCINTMILSVVL